MTGTGNAMRSSITGSSCEASVSPVPVSFRPTKAAMSPASTSLISARLSACIWNMRPMRSRWSFVVFMHHVAGLQRAGIDAHEGQRAVFVVDDLEGEAGERRLRIGLDHGGAWPVLARSSSPSSAATLMPGTSIGDGR